VRYENSRLVGLGLIQSQCMSLSFVQITYPCGGRVVGHYDDWGSVESGESIGSLLKLARGFLHISLAASLTKLHKIKNVHCYARPLLLLYVDGGWVVVR
jgi:hypothetical protein